MSSIAAAPVSVALNLLLDGPFGATGAGVALLATETTVLCIELWCARDVLSSFVRPRDLARMMASNAAAVAVGRRPPQSVHCGCRLSLESISWL